MNRPGRELKRIARANLVHNYRIPMGALLAQWTIPLAIELPFSMVQGRYPTPAQNVAFLAASFLIQLIAYILAAGVSRIHLNIARKKESSFSMVFSCFRDCPDRCILAGIFEMLAGVLGLIPFIVVLAFVYPADTPAEYAALAAAAGVSLTLVIYCQLNLSLMLFLVIDRTDLRVTDCLKQSIRLMRGKKGRLLYLYLSFLGLQLLNLLSLFAGSVWVCPYQSQVLTNFYLDATGQLPAPTQAPPGNTGYRPFSEYL